MNRKKGFNEFLDRHRDPKDIEREVLEVSGTAKKGGKKNGQKESTLVRTYYNKLHDDCNHAGQIEAHSSVLR